MHADLTTFALDIIAVPPVDEVFVDILAGGIADGLCDPHGGTRGGVAFEAVMRFGNFNVVIVTKLLGDLCGQGKKQVHTQAHIRSLENGDGFTSLINLCM